MEVINNFTRDVIISCGDDVITMSIDEEHVIIRIVEPCTSLMNISSLVSYTVTAVFDTASVSSLTLLIYHHNRKLQRLVSVDCFRVDNYWNPHFTPTN